MDLVFNYKANRLKIHLTTRIVDPGIAFLKEDLPHQQVRQNTPTLNSIYGYFKISTVKKFSRKDGFRQSGKI